MFFKTTAAVLTIGLLLFVGLAAASAQSPSRDQDACTITEEEGKARQNKIEIGDPGSGLPQAVHQTWRITKNCDLVLVDEEKEFRGSPEGEPESLGSVCKWVSMQQWMDDIIGIDLTKVTSGVSWCFDISASEITYLGPGQASAWAETTDGWTVDNLADGSYWYSQPHIAEHLAHGTYHFQPTNNYYHSLQNIIRVWWDGTRNCYDSHWGQFPIGYDIDVYCATPS